MNRRKRLVFGVLLLAWVLLAAWQVIEHHRVRVAVHAALINRARDISNTLGLVMRSQRRFGVISKERLESALGELIRSGELSSVALLNAAGEVVVSAGPPIDLAPGGLAPTDEHWTAGTVTLMNLVDLGTSLSAESQETNPPIVLPRPDRFPTNRPPPPREAPDGPPPTNFVPGVLTNADGSSNFFPRPPRPRRGEGRPPLGRPFWMSEEEYKAAIEKQGVHSVAMVFATNTVREVVSRDIWMRSLIALLAAAAVAGVGVAWRNVVRSSELEVRLVRASELNRRLKEMNLAAAGLAHETKKPLSIIRDLAEVISKQEDAPRQTRERSEAIVGETDRVTAQLNEFLNYSRPRETRCVPVSLASVTSEVIRTLGNDVAEKSIRLEVDRELPVVEADEQLLRQLLFNLLLNAVQAVGVNGEIRVMAEKTATGDLALEVRDDGPGVPPELRSEIFKPYFTTRPKGIGLGLAVVQQIVLAHGWEIACLPNEPRGAVFRISHLRLAAAA
jgi:signal transduction histidine kinase